ncbi:MAG TPA: hypothetical protein VN863_03590 [Candidatus Dormibacteraeota bacterium]|nr:hypothetical protein [Candidatus Dormibacteraeota bacterium]
MTEATEKKKATRAREEELRLQARMFDMGHAPKERVVNRVLQKIDRDRKAPSDERLHEILADEHTREDIQDLYG